MDLAISSRSEEAALIVRPATLRFEPADSPVGEAVGVKIPPNLSIPANPPERDALRPWFGASARDSLRTRGRAGASCPPARFRGAPWAPVVAGTAWPFGPSASEAEAPEGRRHEQ